MYEEQWQEEPQEVYSDLSSLEPLQLAKGLALGLLGALLGAALWTAVVAFAHIQFGLIALGIGFGAGFGMSMGVGHARGPLLQGLAAGLALVGYLVGKVAIMLVLANMEGIPFSMLLAPETWPTLGQGLIASLDFMDLLWGGLAAWMGWSTMGR